MPPSLPLIAKLVSLCVTTPFCFCGMHRPMMTSPACTFVPSGTNPSAVSLSYLYGLMERVVRGSGLQKNSSSPVEWFLVFCSRYVRYIVVTSSPRSTADLFTMTESSWLKPV